MLPIVRDRSKPTPIVRDRPKPTIQRSKTVLKQNTKNQWATPESETKKCYCYLLLVLIALKTGYPLLLELTAFYPDQTGLFREVGWIKI
jgi:hypothetical protein